MDEAKQKQLEGLLSELRPREKRLLLRGAAAPTRRTYGEGSVFLVGKVWYYGLSMGGVQKTWSSRSTVKADAIGALQRKREELARGGPMRDVAIGELFSDVLQDYRSNGHATIPDCETRLRLWLGPFFGCRNDEGEFKKGLLAQRLTEEQITSELRHRRSHGLTKFSGGMTAKLVTNVHAQRFLEMRREAGAQTSTIANELAALRRALRLGLRNRKLGVQAVIAMPKNADNVRSGFLEPAQFALLRDALPENVAAIVTVAYSTGMRRTELTELTWDKVNLREGFIRLRGTDTKNGRPRTIKLFSQALEVLKRQRAVLDGIDASFPLVFFRSPVRNEKKGSLLPLGDFSRAWETACRAVGLDGLLFHDMRRSAIRNMTRAGVSERVAMSISGHKTRSVFDRYDIISEADLEAAAAKVDSVEPTQQPRTEVIRPQRIQ